MEARKKEEKKFHDHVFSENLRGPSVSKFYSIVRSSRDFYTKLLLKNCGGKRILEYGCGKGSYTFLLAKNGAQVIGIDISPVAIKFARAKAREENISESTKFIVMDAENLKFPNNYFDVVCGTGILHHLDLDNSFKEISRVLKPLGKAFFIEPMGHNPAINFYRKRTPHLRTHDEHPLKMRDVELLKRYFKTVKSEFFYFLLWGPCRFVTLLYLNPC